MGGSSSGYESQSITCTSSTACSKLSDVNASTSVGNVDAHPIGDEPVSLPADAAKPDSVADPPGLCAPSVITCDGTRAAGTVGNSVFDVVRVGDEPAFLSDAESKAEDAARLDRRAHAEDRKKERLESGRELQEVRKHMEVNSRKPRSFGRWTMLNFFMGKKLPGSYSKVSDSEILLTIQEFMKSEHVGDLDHRVRTLALQFCDLHLAAPSKDKVIMPDKSVLVQSLRKCKVDSLWATYVQGQNAIIFVHRLSETSTHVAAWPIQPASHEVLRAVPGFVRVPEVASIVPWAIVSGESFSRRMAELATNAIRPSTKNNGDVKSPPYVMDYLLPALGGDPVDLTQEWQCIAKKVRDESRLDEGKKQPWRRSPTWLAVKSLLHFACVRTGHDQGRVAYKVLLARLLGEAMKGNENVFDDDSARVEAARKLARRLLKLQNLGGKDVEQAVCQTTGAVKIAMRPVEQRWSNICEDAVPSEVIVSKIDFEQDTTHRLDGCKPVLDELLKSSIKLEHSSHKLPKCASRVEVASKKPFSDHLDRLSSLSLKEQDDVATSLFDVECAVMRNWEQWDTTRKMTQDTAEMLQLLPLLNAYTPIADKFYKSDVEGRSRMVLTMFTMALLVDRLVCKEYALAAEHAIGMDLSVLEDLLLASARGKKLLHSIELYVDARRAKEREKHTSILCSDVHQHAFSVRFAQQHLRSVLQGIQSACDRFRDEKRQEVEKLKIQFDGLNSSAKNLKCLCDTPKTYTAFNNNTTAMPESVQQMGLGKRYNPACVRCTNIGKANQLKVSFYEPLLPANQCIKAAVVFELQIPASVACLRDILHAVTKFSSSRPIRGSCSDLLEGKLHGPVRGSWESDERLKQWHKAHYAQYFGGAATVRLAFTNVTAVPEDQKVSTHESFVVENEKDAVLVDMATKESLVNSRQWCLTPYLKVETRDPQYKTLQFAIESWKHCENDVIARKSQAHGSLSLHEFESFGCLRAGVRLQLPRLARALAQHSLSFDRHGVLDLLFTLLTQSGPPVQARPASSGAWRRQGHELFGNPGICDDICQHAAFLLKDQELNWTRHRPLFAVVMIGRCVLQHADNTSQACQLLVNCRRVACDWIHKVRALMVRSSEADAQKLRIKLIDIAATATLTYDCLCKELLKTDQDAATFVWLRAVLSDNVMLCKIQVAKTEPYRQNLLRKAFRVALELEDQLHALCNTSDALILFINQHWGDAHSGSCGKWVGLKGPSKRWYETVFSGAQGKTTLQVDVIRGVFLVNGMPVGQLPKDITNHEDYLRVFGDAMFEVQPAVGGGWRTLPRKDGISFLFALPSKTGQAPIIIEERLQDDGTQLTAQLVSHRHFSGDFPDAFVEEHSHWFVRSAISQVFFRPRRYDAAEFKSGCNLKGAAFVLSLESNKLVESATGRCLVDVKSKSFTEIYSNVFRRLAPAGQVHVFHGNRATTVVLPRLNGLQFHVVGGKLRSHEFGSFVAPNQQFGTLIGLQHGLLLQDSTDDRTVLIPHAAAHRVADKQEVTLEVDQLRQPPLFVYTVRDDLRELHGQKDRLAWIYLAKLHALTAGLLPDPFLERTGTSQALHLLGSGRCRGNLNSSADATTTLVETTLLEIACCTPARQTILRNDNAFAERVDFHCHCLPPISTHEGFAWIVSAMQKETQQAVRLGQKKAYTEEVSVADTFRDRLGQLNRRAYLQSLELYAADSRLCVEDESEIMGPMRALMSLEPFLISYDQLKHSVNVQALARSMRDGRTMRTQNDPRKLLLQPRLEKLKGVSGTLWHEQSIDCWWKLCDPESFTTTSTPSSLLDMWIDLYSAARGCTGKARNHQMDSLRFCLSFFAMQQPSLAEYLIQLSSVAVHADRYSFVEPPVHSSYVLPNETEYDPKLIDRIIDQFTDSYQRVEAELIMKVENSNPGQKESQAEPQRKQLYKDARQRSKKLIVDAARDAFTAGKKIDKKKCEQELVSDPDAVADAINLNFGRWRQNNDLRRFLDKVWYQLQETQNIFGSTSWGDLSRDYKPPDESVLRPKMFRVPTPQPEQVQLTADDLQLWKEGCASRQFVESDHPSPTLDSCATEELPIAVGKQATQVYERLLAPLREGWALASVDVKTSGTRKFDADAIRPRLSSCLSVAVADAERVITQIKHAIASTSSVNGALEASGLWPSTAPTVLLPSILEQCGRSDSWRQAVGVLAVLLRTQQHARRCLKLLDRGDAVRLERELQNQGCKGWTPQDHPEWLLLELDNDFTIRGEQAAVAKEIMSDSHGNRLLQLLMGAGKTAVIIPMIIATLADGKRCLRVTVPGPLYATNMVDWQLKMGGLLGKRVYPMVCRRDLQIENHAAELLRMLKYICHDRHVIVTVPEHRLSLENKMLELGAGGDVQKCAAVQQVLQFLENHGRDVLDESDEILHPKFQLIYTLGKPLDLDGGRLRWSLGAAVLLSVARHAPALRAQYGAQAVEFEENENEQHFPAVRLLDAAKDQAYARLCELVVNDFLSGLHPQIPVILKPAEVALWRRAVLDKEAPDDSWNTLSHGLQQITLLLRGFLAHMVLFMSLHKRWRVEYGGQPRGSTRMAVPYRAKDVASEKTEFGHPDVALLLTTLHYYHQGLSRDQLQQTFKRLARKGVAIADATYSSWTQDTPALTVRAWSAVNLDDAVQFDGLLLPALRRNMKVINFWLDHFVFPVEAKQFAQKMVSTPWDLCRDDCSRITTGFAGTDDAHLMLPLSIQQVNMIELKKTNGALLHNLLRTENDAYEALPAGATGRQLLEHVGSNPKLDVLLDSGALVLELTNLEVAHQWLEMRTDRKAAVFFEDDLIKVVDQSGVSMPLAVSPYERSLQDCLLYLDDEHTRGSDFSLPHGRRAAVTLGKGLQKDKLAQTVMRMRQLGRGHSVCFVASFEAELQIASWRNDCKARLGTCCNLQHLPAVLSWCLSNTVQSTCDKLTTLASQGAAQIRKRHLTNQHASNLHHMASEVAERELVTLQELYGSASVLEPMPQIIQRKLHSIVEHLDGHVSESLVKLASSIVDHVRDLVPDVCQSTGLHDEEHERELEQELEEERERVDRPDAATPAVPAVSEGLVAFAQSGSSQNEPFLSLNIAFQGTCLANLDDGTWDDAVRVTPDFVHTIERDARNDSFLRPVTWMLATQDGRTVLISNYEAEYLAAHFGNSRVKVRLQLVTPSVRRHQVAAFPSVPDPMDLPVSVHVFAGSVHGSEGFLQDVRAFLGLCVRQPASPLWRELFEQKGAITTDGFVLPEFHVEAANKLGITIKSKFSKSPLQLLQRLYEARHLSERLVSSPVGQLFISGL